ncbi:hypothetical protein D7V88_06245 [Corallococcus terminator]|uniref:Collagen-like protein n=1 Tax=Corallococcus terminator TaxID=2316733 RepID=A0A3A8JBW1_9BACT|nr:hypothetical protein D7V88_06245 [Corallococcus terminator]
MPLAGAGWMGVSVGAPGATGATGSVGAVGAAGDVGSFGMLGGATTGAPSEAGASPEGTRLSL